MYDTAKILNYIAYMQAYDKYKLARELNNPFKAQIYSDTNTYEA